LARKRALQGTASLAGNQGNYAGLYTSPYPGSTTGLLTPLVTGKRRQSRSSVVRHRARRAGYLVTPTLLLYGTPASRTARDRLPTEQHQAPAGRRRRREWLFARIGRRSFEYLYLDLASSGINGAYPVGSWATTIIPRSTSCAPA